MKVKVRLSSHCPVHFGLESIGDRWSLLIVRDIVFFGKKTYGEFLKAGEGIATNVLASRLEFLESIDVLKKTPHKGDRRKDIYSLTEKGLDLIPIMFEIVRWSATHDPKSEALQQPAFVKRLKRNPGKLIRETRELVRSGGSLFSNAKP